MKNKGKTSLYMGVFQILCGFILVAMISGEKESWKYYISSSHRSNVDTGSMIGWLIVIAGVAELIYGLVALYTADEVNSAGSESAGKEPVISQVPDPWVDGEIIKKEWDHERHQIEWIVIKKKNGAPARFWHYTTDGCVYTIGDTGRAMVKDGKITEFISNKQDV